MKGILRRCPLLLAIVVVVVSASYHPQDGDDCYNRTLLKQMHFADESNRRDERVLFELCKTETIRAGTFYTLTLPSAEIDPDFDDIDVRQSLLEPFWNRPLPPPALVFLLFWALIGLVGSVGFLLHCLWRRNAVESSLLSNCDIEESAAAETKDNDFNAKDGECEVTKF